MSVGASDDAPEGQPWAADQGPHSPSLLQATLRPDLISANARALLNQSLSQGRTVCFLGSGVSMAYGRLSWQGLIHHLYDEHGPQETPTPTDRAAVLLQDLGIKDRSPDDELQSGRYPAAFQYLEQVLRGRNADSKLMRREVAELLFDDRGHIYTLIRQLLLDHGLVSTLGKSMIRTAAGLETVAPANYPQRALHHRTPPSFSRHFDLTPALLDAWQGELPGLDRINATASSELFAAIRSELPAAKAGEPVSPLTPSLRFVVTALWRLRPRGSVENAITQPLESLGEPRNTGERAPLFDPLLVLAKDLGVGRFLTTNYDLDLERLLRDRGFHARRQASSEEYESRSPSRSATTSVNGLGASATDSVFAVERAAELIEFAVARPHHSLQVMHLHGRATVGSEMVITEEDYLRQYLGADAHSEVVNDALDLAFGANTLLFVGSGMGEDDVLRPLRQFVSERRAREDRAAIVLLPARSSKGKQLEEVIALYARYGVHTIHYGTRPESRSGGQIRWLPFLLALVRALDGALASIPAAEAQKSAQAWEAFQKDMVAVETLLQEDTLKAKYDIRREDFLKVDSGRRRIGLPGHLEGREPPPSGHETGLATPLALINAAMDFATAVATELSARIAAGRLPDATLPSDVWQLVPDWPEEFGSRPALVQAYRAVLDGLPNVLIGASLCLKLQSIHRDWEAERNTLQWLPRPRWPGGPRWGIEPLDPLLPGEPNPPAEDRRTHFDKLPVHSRHSVALGLSPVGASKHQSSQYSADTDPSPRTDRFFAGAPSQTFRTLYSALQRSQVNDDSSLTTPHEKAGRRVFVFLAPRGVGKGHFFEAMRTQRRIGEFIKFSWPGSKLESAPYAAFAYFNLSFSLEVISAFDRLSQILAERAHKVFGLPPENATHEEREAAAAVKIVRAFSALKTTRIERLTAILRLYDEHRKDARSRVFVAFSSFNVLFDERGYAKNAELHRAVQALLGPHVRRAPIDLALICTESGFPAVFTHVSRGHIRLEHSHLDNWQSLPRMPLEVLVRQELSEKGRHQVQNLISHLHVSAARGPIRYRPRGHAKAQDAHATQQPSTKADTKPGDDWPSNAYLHVLREARTSNTVAKYFPDVALALALQAGALSRDDPVLAADDVVPGPTRLKFASDSGLVFAIRDEILHGAVDYQHAEAMIVHIPSGLVRLAAWINGQGKGAGGAEVDANEGDFRTFTSQEAFPPLKDPSSVAKAPKLGREAEVLDGDFGVIAGITCRNRYLLTLASAVASELAWSGQHTHQPSGAYSGTGTLDCRKVVDWFATLRTHLTTLEIRDREDKIIEMSLDRYQGMHECNSVPSLGPNFYEDLRQRLRALEKATSSHLDQEFICAQLRRHPGWTVQQRLLWHLAIVCHPVERDVLARAPGVREAAMALLCQSAKTFDSDEQNVALQDCIDAVVRCSLDMLVRRCLVFRLHAANVDAPDARWAKRAWSGSGRQVVDRKLLEGAEDEVAVSPDVKADEAATPDARWRFALHRFVQRAMFKNLHAPFVEHPHIDQFGLSLWCTQPDDLPKPNWHAVRDIAEVVRSWAGASGETANPEAPNAFDMAFKAASRTGNPSLPSRMLHAAFGIVRSVYSVGVISRYHDFEFDDPPSKGSDGYFQQHRRHVYLLIQQAARLQRLNPEPKDLNLHGTFFAEEIVWLYNECGLFYLVEGRLDLAAEMFDMALLAAGRLEGRIERGALWCRIQLNRAVVDIERGRLREARRVLVQMRDVADENPILRVLAQGFIALVEHYSGNYAVAEQSYQKVISDLDTYGQSRSVAIFSRHLADLYRARGPAGAADAVRAIDRSIAAATKGGHEDIRQMSRLSRLRLAIRGLVHEPVEDVQASLDEIGSYGVKMGMPRMQADVAYARATHLLSLGETRHAATLAREAISVAHANNLQLRKMTALVLLAKIYRRRGLHKVAAPLFKQASALAESCDYANIRAGALAMDVTLAA